VAPPVASFLFEVVNFVALVAALGWLFFRPVRAALESERARLAEAERTVAELRAQAETLTREVRAAREERESETERRCAGILAAAEREAARIREESRQGVEAERRTVEGEVAARRRAQASALAEAIGRIAAASVRRLLESLEGPSLDLALVRGACEELRALPPAVREAATVEVARPLGLEARGALRDVLGTTFTERAVAELGAGVRVTTGAGQVDASALALARRAARDTMAVAAGEEGDAES
jgi:F-type H+-transporting ATPase subunit b